MGTRLRLALARALPIALAVLLAPLDAALACTCIPSTLSSRFERSENVFTATVTAQSRQPSAFGPVFFASFDVSESFKGRQPFRELVSDAATVSCSLHLEVGTEYLFFAPDSGELSGCAGIVRAEDAEREIAALRTYVAQDYPAIAEPWEFSSSDAGCSLRTAFDRGDEALPGVLEISASSERARVLQEFDLAELSVRFDGSREPPDDRAPLRLLVGQTTATAHWTVDRSVRVSMPSSDTLVVPLFDSYVLAGDPVEAVLRELAKTNPSPIYMLLGDPADRRAFQIHTANLGQDGARMLECLLAERAK